MKLSKYAFLFVFILVFSFSFGYSCQPTIPLTLSETIYKSDLIIIGMKIAEGPVLNKEYPYPGDPEWVDIQILEVFKGDVYQEIIRINTNSPCGYGFPVPYDFKENMMFFSWDENSNSYVRVDLGSKTIINVNDEGIFNDYVDNGGELKTKFITFEELEKNYGLISSKVVVEDKFLKYNQIAAIILITITVLVLLMIFSRYQR